MPTKDDLPIVRQVRTIREEFATRGAIIQPGRYSFASQAELHAYLIQALGGKAERGGIGGFLSRKGKDDYNDNHVERMDWGVYGQQPERVAGVCQAQWHHRQFADLVTAGSGCLRYKSDTWPSTFPTDWTPIITAINLSGSWTDGSNRSAAISVTRRSFSIDMSAFGRPRANGTIVGYTDITATFPDDRTYNGQLTQPRTIIWSNGSIWTKIVNTVFDLNGSWSDGSPWISVIYEGATSLTVDMSDFDRPTAHGNIIDSSTIAVTFPDDQTYTGTLQGPNTIRWSNGSAWTRKA
jgi:hypothetical protein